MKWLSLLLAVAALSAAGIARAQNVAPGSLAGSLLTVTVAKGHAPFATNGTYRFFTSVSGTNYTLLGHGGPLSSGACTYATGGPSTALATLADAQGGAGISLTLGFASPTNGTLGLTNATGFQTGAFTLTRYAELSPAELFLPSLAGGQFRSLISGQPGFVYLIEASSDLVHWLPRLNVPVVDMTANVSDAAGQAACYYRARIGATGFAPGDLTNKTLNLTVSDGASPLASNGICQWVAGSNDLSYQLIAGPGTWSGKGAYTYSNGGGNSSSLKYLDSLSTNPCNVGLYFTSPDAGYFYLTNAGSKSTGFEAGTFTMADGAVEFLGNAKFTPDSARAGSFMFAADGTSASLSVTNAHGWIWTLDFPSDALAFPETITMTPFATVDSSQSLLPLTSGVLLEPDGLQFDDGVTLTVSSPGPFGPHAALMLARGDGGGLYFVGSTNQTRDLSATLFHFTSAVVTDPSDAQWSAYMQEELPQAQLAYAQATNAVQALMARATNVPPPPPDHAWGCALIGNPVALKTIDDYIRSLFSSENAAIDRLMSAASELSSFGQNYNSNATKLVKKLIETDEYGQVDYLFGRYYYYNTNAEVNTNFNGDPEKFLAVYRLSLAVNQQDIYYGGKSNSFWTTLCKNWSKNIRDVSVKAVHDSHFYSFLYAAFDMETFRNTVMGIAPDVTGGFQTKVAKAMCFKMSTDMNFTMADPAPGPDDVWEGGSIEAQGEGTLQGSSPQAFGDTTNNFIQGTQYFSDGSGTGTLDSGQSFVMQYANIAFTCNQVFVLPGGADETENWTWVWPDGSVTTDQLYPGFFSECFDACDCSGDFWSFPLKDGDPELVNQTVQVQSDDGWYSGTIHFQVQHTPQ